MRDYQAGQADYADRTADYQAAKRDYDRRLSQYQAERDRYDRRYGSGAYVRVYGPAPSWDSASPPPSSSPSWRSCRTRNAPGR